MEMVIATLLPVLLLLGSVAGWMLRQRLSERHRGQEAAQALQILMSMMITFAALVLGLLTSSAKSDFDGQVRQLRTFSIHLIELNQRMREYGPDADPARSSLRHYTSAAIVDTWPHEPPPPGEQVRVATGPQETRMENAVLGDMLLHVDEQIGSLLPITPLQKRLLPVLERDMSSVLEGRWQIVAGLPSGMSWPFLSVLLLWLTLAFFTFGLSTPPSRLNAVVLALSAISVSAAVFLIADFGTPLSGLLSLPSAPMRDALSHMGAPPAGLSNAATVAN